MGGFGSGLGGGGPTVESAMQLDIDSMCTSGRRDGAEEKMAPWSPRLMLMSGSLRQIAREFAHLREAS